jgi:L-asparaginase
MTGRCVVLANSVADAGVGVAAEVLRLGAPALDVVEAGIRPVEIDPTVDSVGVGGLPNLLGQVELDAAIMDGGTQRCGAVGALRGYLHPISVARQVLERLPHVLLVGDGAAHFAAECGAETGPTLTPEATARYQAWLAGLPGYTPFAPSGALAPWARRSALADGPQSEPNRPGGTTTFLVRDGFGTLAAGVSTSGWAYKYPGRLGDSPIIGAGSYADNRFGAAACTGQGELAIRAGTARAVVLYLKVGLSVRDACLEAVADLRALSRDYGGAITLHALDASGQPWVVAVGDGADTTYWFWEQGMAAPERRAAESIPW